MVVWKAHVSLSYESYVCRMYLKYNVHCVHVHVYSLRLYIGILYMYILITANLRIECAGDIVQ